jgi:enterochelin esterase-like enzyme
MTMMSIRRIFLLTGTLFALIQSSMGQTPKLSSGSLKRLQNFPSKYVQPRTVDVWVPDGYDPKTKKYSVLYMQDGQMLFDSTITWNKQEWMVDETMGELMARKQIRDVIVVAIWNTVIYRHAEYFPQKAIDGIPKEYLPELMPLIRNKPLADDYLKFLVTELKPWVDSNYATIPDQRNTFIAGSSMGALISLYAVCEYPSVFRGAACLSTHWTGTFEDKGNPIPGAILQYLKTHLPKPADHKFYFDHGTVTLDSMYRTHQDAVDALFQGGGYTILNYSSREFAGEDHSERAWARRLYIPAIFLLSGK